MKIYYRFLTASDFADLYQTLLEAFSDYLPPLELSESQFENHIAQNAVDLNLSVGAFFEDKMIGYTLNGFGLWNGKETAYDAGTGVIPAFRNRGIGTAMFDFLLPKLRLIGIEQMVLEVIEGNEKAIALYLKFGFEVSRKLLFFEADRSIMPRTGMEFEIREIESPDWKFLQTFWDGNTSWQFSSESIARKILPKIVFGAFVDERCVGYSVVYPTSGLVPQIAVDKDFRRNGVASALLKEMQLKTEEQKPLRFSNVDGEMKETLAFFEKIGFQRTISQFEMVMPV